MSLLAEQVLKVTRAELERTDWKIVLTVLREAQRRIPGRQSWMDGAIGIAESRSQPPLDSTRLHE